LTFQINRRSSAAAMVDQRVQALILPGRHHRLEATRIHRLDLNKLQSCHGSAR
jgi:hypothetical protein